MAPILAFALLGCQNSLSEAPPGANSNDGAAVIAEPVDADRPSARAESDQTLDWAVALVAGLPNTLAEGPTARHREAFERALETASGLLDRGEPALRVAEETIVVLEDDPLFNAGRGATFTRRGTHELDATMIDGRTLAVGSVSALRNIRNPIVLARRVLEAPEVLLIDGGADQLAREHSVRRAPQDYFTTDESMEHWRADRRSASISYSGSVGVVLKDRYGNLASAASSGGTTDRRFHQPDAAAVAGAGLYADNQRAAVVAVGPSSLLQSRLTAYSVVARIGTSGALEEAVEATFDDSSLAPMGVVAIAPSGRCFAHAADTKILQACATSQDRE